MDQHENNPAHRIVAETDPAKITAALKAARPDPDTFDKRERTALWSGAIARANAEFRALRGGR